VQASDAPAEQRRERNQGRKSALHIGKADARMNAPIHLPQRDCVNRVFKRRARNAQRIPLLQAVMAKRHVRLPSAFPKKTAKRRA
jgi:hypothetical protein